MALLPGYRYLEVGETIPAGALVDLRGHGHTVTERAGDFCNGPNTYMIPIDGTVAPPPPVRWPRRSYMPSETSLQAHASQKDKAPNDGAKILQFIAKSTETGCTCDEVETLLQFSHQTASARIRDLAKASKIRDSGLRRKTRTGRSATVWKAA